MAHTPGPWHWLEEEYHDDAIGPWTINDGSTNDLATVYSDENATGPKISRDEAIANARLIAAAPDLLAALRVVSERWEDADNCTPTWAERELILTAIAKAEGR